MMQQAVLVFDCPDAETARFLAAASGAMHYFDTNSKTLLLVGMQWMPATAAGIFVDVDVQGTQVSGDVIRRFFGVPSVTVTGG